MKKSLSLSALLLLLLCVVSLADDEATKKSNDPATLTLVVMDPLCDRLACDCVEGYAQRKYEVLGAYLTRELKRPVKVFWGETIESALEETKALPDIVIGKFSVVQHDAKSQKQKLKPVAQLTGSTGEVTQTGLIVVRKNDPAKNVADLSGYRLFFGPKDCDEKYAAPIKLLKKHGIEIPAKKEISAACSKAATKLVELDKEIPAAAIISSYAEPLLAGCGTIKKGDLRVIGVSEKVPFVTAFVNQRLSDSLEKEITKALLDSGAYPELTKSLQSLIGFLPYKEIDSSKTSDKKKVSRAKTALPQNRSQKPSLSQKLIELPVRN